MSKYVVFDFVSSNVKAVSEIHLFSITTVCVPSILSDSSMPKAERNKIAIGAAGLLLGLVVCAAGLLYYRKTSRG